MIDNENGEGNVQKASLQQVYQVVYELRSELSHALMDMDAKWQERFDTLFVRLDTVIGGIRSEFVSVESFKRSADDRQKLWEAVHKLEENLRWAVITIIGVGITLTTAFILDYFARH
jgi:hypothetical protein